MRYSALPASRHFFADSTIWLQLSSETRKEVTQLRTYERPTLTAVGPFRITGLGGSGPRDLLFRHQVL
jgi:uncharacterized protein DUF5972